MTEHATVAQQGHRYQLGDRQVLAMESSSFPRKRWPKAKVGEDVKVAIDMHPNDLVLLQHDGFVSTKKLYVPDITKAVLQATGYLLELEESQIQVNPDAHFLKAQNKKRFSNQNPMLARVPAGLPHPLAS